LGYELIKQQKTIFLVSTVSVIAFFFLIMFSSPLLIQNALIQLDASAQGLSSSGGKAGVSTGASSKGGSGSGGVITALEDKFFIDISLESNSFNSRNPNNFNQGLFLTWDSTDIPLIENIILPQNDIISFNETPFFVKNIVVIDGESSSRIVYSISDMVPFGVHQFPITITILNGDVLYETQNIVTIDNTGIFPILEFIRTMFTDKQSEFRIIA